MPLLQKLKPYHPDFEKGKLTKEKLLQRVQPDGTFSLSRINNLLSKGFIAAEDFLVFHSLKNDKNLRNDLLTRELQSRHLEDWFFKNIDSELERLDSKPVKDWEDHLDLLRLHRRVYHHPTSSTRMKPGGQTIVEMGKQLDLVYLLERAAIINEKIFRNRILKNENHEVEKELKVWSVAAEGVEYPAVELYRMRFEYDSENRLNQFNEIKNRFLSIHKSLGEKEQKIHLISLLNDFSQFFRNGSLKIEDSLPLYKLGIETRILLDEGRLSRTRYVTIVSVSNTKGDFEYSELFIEKFTNKLEEKIQPDALNWALAHTAYRKGKLSESLDYLIHHNYKVTYFQLTSKVLTTQVYFDLFLEDDSYQWYLFNFFDSFEKWIQREKIREKNFKEGYLKFIQNTRRLAKTYLKEDFELDKAKLFLIGEKNVQVLDWLLKKKEEVIERKKPGHSIIETT